MAKTYLEAHGQAKFVILDYAESVGGTWASERLYPGLKTNNMVGSYEFSDFPLVPGQYSIEPGQHIPGRVVHSYLCDFCDAFGLTSRIRFMTKVDSARLLPNGEWQVAFTTRAKATAGADSQQVNRNAATIAGTLVASKLVLATGLTSEPFMPPLPGRERFNGPVFHAKDFKVRAQELTGAKTVVVIGGNKSAWDICYSSATKFGAKAHMVVRRSGGGPSWCWPARMKGFLPSISSVSATRLYTWFDPNPYGRSARYLRALIHRTQLGRMLSGLFWSHLDDKVTRLNAYDESPGLANLRPWISTFWMGNSLSVHNYETSWFDLARSGQIAVHAAEVSSLSATAAHLSDGTIIEADAVVFCTGWEVTPSIKFVPEDLVEKLGFPGTNTKTTDPVLEARVRAEILQWAPILKEKPVRQLPNTLRPEGQHHNFDTKPTMSSQEGEVMGSTTSSPYRLYRFVIPCSPDFIRMKNLAVIGAHITLHTAVLSQVQALWITAFFDDMIPHLAATSRNSQLGYDKIKQEAYYDSEYQRMRRPKETGGTGSCCPDLVFDSIPYADVLLSDLGLSNYRKSSWYKEMTEPYGVGDFRGLVKEWLQKTKN
jgi:hypothetical protein